MIKKELGVSKSTLSVWLRDYPLSKSQISGLRDKNPRRVEKFRNTMRKKRESRLKEVYSTAKNKIGNLNNRELIIAGFFLYWAEGQKTSRTTTAMANTDPAMVRFFVYWLKLIGAPVEKLKVKLHIYSDMEREKVIDYWQKELDLPLSCFGQVYVKESKLSNLSYKTGFGHGTANIIIHDRNLSEYVLMAVKYIREKVSKK